MCLVIAGVNSLQKNNGDQFYADKSVCVLISFLLSSRDYKQLNLEWIVFCLLNTGPLNTKHDAAKN